MQQTQLAQWIQALYNERDQALARNRDLEEWLQVARVTINNLAKRNGELERAIRESPTISQETTK